MSSGATCGQGCRAAGFAAAGQAVGPWLLPGWRAQQLGRALPLPLLGDRPGGLSELRHDM